MTQNSHAPDSIRLVHGMEHAGLSDAALTIERSRAFKRSFIETISNQLGFESADTELVGAVSPSIGLEDFLRSFGADGHPAGDSTRTFLDAVLAARYTGPSASITTGTMLRDCCVRWPPDWLNCGGYALDRDGQPWTIEDAVAGYEGQHGAITDSAVQDELAAIRVYVQIEWEIRL